MKLTDEEIREVANLLYCTSINDCRKIAQAQLVKVIPELASDKVREEIARDLHWHDWDCEVSMAYNYGDSGEWDEQDNVLHEYYFKQADKILAIIKKAIEVG